MKRNTYIVIFVIIIVSLIYSAVMYFTISQAFEATMLRTADFWKNSSLSKYYIDGNESLYLHQSICDFEINRSYFRIVDTYEGKLGSCNKDKIIEFYNSKNFSKEKVYFRLASFYAQNDLQNSFSSVINELYPNEKHLFYEKFYDSVGTAYFFVKTGEIASGIGLFRVCEEYLNQSGDCAYELFQAEKKVTQKLLDQTNFDDNYVNSCISNIDQIIKFPLDARAFCSRLGLIHGKMMEKSLSKEHLDHSKFLIATLFYYLNNLGDFTVRYSISNLIANEIDPKYKPYFVNASL